MENCGLIHKFAHKQSLFYYVSVHTCVSVCLCVYIYLITLVCEHTI